MAKKANNIALELKALERKMQEFRDYLDDNKIKNIVEYNERHQEIKIQILIIEKLGPLTAQFDLLKKQADEDLSASKAPNDIRGDVPLSPLEEGII